MRTCTATGPATFVLFLQNALLATQLILWFLLSLEACNTFSYKRKNEVADALLSQNTGSPNTEELH